jgi:hypothetical protein
MTPQARIKARLAEDAAAAGVRLSVTARRSAARYFTEHTYNGLLLYLIVFGDWDADRQFQRKAGLSLPLTSGGPGDRTYSFPSELVERMLAETELDPAWLSSTSRRLARSIRAERGFAQLPLLADALEEAGCTNHFVLEHCRAGAPHEQTCWVIELMTAAGSKRQTREK